MQQIFIFTFQHSKKRSKATVTSVFKVQHIDIILFQIFHQFTTVIPITNCNGRTQNLLLSDDLRLLVVIITNAAQTIMPSSHISISTFEKYSAYLVWTCETFSICRSTVSTDRVDSVRTRLTSLKSGLMS